MNSAIRVGIMGYGNLGRGVEMALRQNADMVLTAIFTRRDPAALHTLTPDAPVCHIDRLPDYQSDIDVLILCGGSANDLPVQSPECARLFSIVDSFDTHAGIPEHFARCDTAAREAGTTALISAGWDPGLFSLMRLFGESVLPDGVGYTFWGKGISQGHSDAIRCLPGVRDARQYTVPVPEALMRVRSGENPDLSVRDMHKRICYVVAEENADLAQIEHDIQTMPHYFSDYDTTVHFITEEELRHNHCGMPHGGIVMRSGLTGADTRQMMEFSLKLGSNPEFTAGVLVCCARAVKRMNDVGMHGAKTLFDVPPAWLSARSGAELRRMVL